MIFMGLCTATTRNAEQCDGLLLCGTKCISREKKVFVCRAFCPFERFFLCFAVASCGHCNDNSFYV